MPTIDHRITNNSRVTLHFSLTATNGTELTSTFGETPAVVSIGSGELSPGMEQVLIGLTRGEHQALTLSAEQAFGPRDPGRIQQLPRTQFAADMALSNGLVIAFETPTGEEVAGIITELQPDRVTVDFNHPLAGREVLFRVEIIDIESPQ